MKKTVVTKYCLASMILSLSLASCMEKDLFVPNNETPSLATFATTQDVQFSMQYDVPAGYANGFDVYAENPIESVEDGTITLRTDIQPIAAGISVSGSFQMDKQVPGYVKELYALSSDLFAPRLMYAKIENGRANFTPKGIGAPIADQAALTTRGTGDLKFDFIPEMNDKYTPASDGTIDVPPAVMTAISKAFPEGYTYKNGATIPPQYVQEASLEILEDAELWITPLLTSCSMSNTFGYICYDGRISELAGKNINQIDEKLRVVFPFASMTDNAVAGMAGLTDLKRGDAFKLKYFDKTKKEWVDKFPKGTTVIWFLWSGSYDRANKKWNSSAYNKTYSHAFWNTDDEQKVHTSYYAIRHDNADYVCFGFEDQKIEKSDKDYNDLIFMVKSNPESAVVPPVVIDDKGNEVVTQTENPYGILAFEDNWPAEGDYDMNDVVVRYNSNITYTKETNTDVYVSQTEDVFTLIHSGATFHNKFAIKYDINPAKVKSIQVNGIATTPRADGNGYVIDVCLDVLDKIAANVPNQSYDYTIVTEFQNNAISQADFQKKKAPYNPYISPQSGLEIHLPMYAPTSDANPKYFRTQKDCSRPEEGIYYIGKEGSLYPWGIHLLGIKDFTIPTERFSIENTYPQYTDWVQSGFTNYQNWYLFSK